MNRIKIVAISLVSLLATYALAGFLLIPWLLTTQLPKIIDQQTGRAAQVSGIDLNPFTLELTVTGLHIAGRWSEQLFAFEQLYVNADLVDSIKNGQLTIAQILLSKPAVTLIRNPQGVFNFADIVAKHQQNGDTSDSSEIFPLSIDSLQISDGELNWEDRMASSVQREKLTPINVTADSFNTLISQHKSEFNVTMNFQSGGQFVWQGEFGLAPLYSQGSIQLEQLRLTKAWELFLQQLTSFRILQGTEKVRLNYQFSMSEQGPQLKLDQSSIALENLQIAARDSEQAVIEIPHFSLSGLSLDLLGKRLTIDRLESDKGHLEAILNADGTLNWQQLFAAADASPTPTTASANASSQPPNDPLSAWNIAVGELLFNGYQLNFHDRSGTQPVTFELGDIHIRSTGLTNHPEKQLPLELEFKLNQHGHVNIAAQATPSPLNAHANVTVQNIAIPDFKHYLARFVQVDLISALIDADLEIDVASAENDKLALKILGNTDIVDFLTQDQISNQELLSWKKLSLEKIDIDLQQNRFNIARVGIDSPYSRLIIRKNKSVNFSEVVVGDRQSKSADETRSNEPPSVALSYQVDQIEIKNGTSDFADFSLILPFSAHMNALDGSIKGISSDKNVPATLVLKGLVADLSPVNIHGTINPHRGDSEIELKFQSMPLPLVTPYMAEFAGRKIEKGNMTLELIYKILNSELTASNNLLIEHLVLGDEVDNPKAVSLPLELAIALLEDSSGKIAMDVPITGSLEDPQFDIGNVIVDALVNVITKIVSAPFNAIASLFDDEENIDRVVFDPGQYSLVDKQREKLDQLAVALSERPALKLEIQGNAYSDVDWPPLQQEALDGLILKSYTEKLNRESESIPKGPIHLSQEQYNETLADLFIDQFPQLAERSFFGEPQLIDPKLGDFFQVAKTTLAKRIPADMARLNTLALQRAQTIAKHLTSQGVSIDRLFLVKAQIDPVIEQEPPASILRLRAD